MADNDKEAKKEVYELTKNVIERNKFMGQNKRNIAEAIISSLLILTIIIAIPFTDLVTTIVCIVLCPVAFIGCLRGVKHLSVTEAFMAELQFRKYRRRLHLRGPQYVRQKSRNSYSESEDESLAEKSFRLLKQRFNEFLDEYGKEEDR